LTPEQCVSQREELLIVAGVLVIIAQQVIMFVERRYYHKRIEAFRYAPYPPPLEEKSFFDKGGGDS